MTKEIILKIASLEHMTKQPPEKKYALFCHDVLGGVGVDCESEARLGHLGDFKTYKEAKKTGIKHSHPVDIRFYPNTDNQKPSDDFIKDFKNNPQDNKI